MDKTTLLCFSLLLATLSPAHVKGWSWTDVALAGAVGTCAVVVAPAVLSVVGFSAAGVGAGSMAAAMQSTFYGGYVASGSLFAAAQSAGAAGIGIKGATTLFSAAAGATLYAREEEE